MGDLNIALVVIGGLVIVMGLFSRPINDRSTLSIPLLALLLGVALGPAALDILDPARWGDMETIVEEAARLTLAIGLMAIALRLPPRYLLHHWRPIAVLIGLVMPLMWVSSSLLVRLAFDLPLVVAFLTGAILTPTDPIVASSIVTAASAKENLPERIRHTLSAESGVNDGLAHLFILLPILLMTQPPEAALRHWVVTAFLWEICGAVIIGVIIGQVAGRLLHWGERKQFIEPTSFLAYTVALALLTLGGARLLGAADVLAVFVAGIAFDSVVGGKERAEEANIQETVNQFFMLPIFTLLGLILPVDQWLSLGWRGFALVVAILFLRRLPAVLAVRTWMRPVQAVPDVLFIGWFGPIGVSALFYAMVALERTGNDAVWAISSLVICASIVAHGMTATPFTKRYGEHST